MVKYQRAAHKVLHRNSVVCFDLEVRIDNTGLCVLGRYMLDEYAQIYDAQAKEKKAHIWLHPKTLVDAVRQRCRQV